MFFLILVFSDNSFNSKQLEHVNIWVCSGSYEQEWTLLCSKLYIYIYSSTCFKTFLFNFLKLKKY